MKVGQREILSVQQYMILLIIFLIGTTVVVGSGEEAKQNLWIAQMIAMCLGIVLIYGYSYLVTRGGGKHLYELLVSTFGKKIGMTVSFGYVLYFFYIVTRNIRDLGELMKVTLMPVTPLEVISITMILVAFYILYLGLEVLGRITEFLAPLVIFFLLVIGVLIYLTGRMQIHHLQPVLAEGFQPILKAVFPTMLTFPYGETVVFMVFMTSVSRINKTGMRGIAAVIISGLLIVYADLVQLTTLGENVKNRSLFPLLIAAREIVIMEFFERIDILVVFILMIGILVKVCVFFYAGLKGIEFVFNIPYRVVLLPLTLIIPLYASLIAENIVSHFEEGLEKVPYLLHLPFQVGIPAILLTFLLFSNKKKKKKEGEVTHG
ncbi:GerAB/ArcD/ProY family transporter [Bacillus solitudinis]|uniref:GerAB/ArcD/ProY family transporter n=1 Tax=Bacillus solitudinis TaxID=2014074 RepID=UPI000C24E431|nr:endospore germination permease [Bacillus solitudinis]